MLIRNDTEQTVEYEIRGGPMGMILNPGELPPGVADEWDGGYGNLEEADVRFYYGDQELNVTAAINAVVALVVGDDGPTVRVE